MTKAKVKPDVKTEIELGVAPEEKFSARFLKYLFEPTRTQLMGLTNLPLSQINNLAWMVVYDVATEQLAEYVARLDREQAAKARGIAFRESPMEMLSLSAIWSEAYAWLRRSIDGDFTITTAGLANKAMETQEFEPEAEDQLRYRNQ